MKRVICFIQAAFALVIISGCVNTELIADIDPTADLSTLQSFYVARFPSDDRGIETMIAAELTSMGKSAKSGHEPKPPAPVDAVVTYEDKWMWDLTMYMLELSIDLRDTETNYKFANARSYRTSLARKSPEEMVKEVLGKLFEESTSGELQ